MQTSSPEKKRMTQGGVSRRLTACGAFLCAALMLSYAEAILVPTGLLPIPGAKLGLANMAVILCAELCGKKSAAAVSLCRVILVFVLFGNITSFIYSLAGAALSFVGIVFVLRSAKLSFIGKSVIAAALHNTAQVICAVFILRIRVEALLPWMLICGALCGAFTGILLNFIWNAVSKSYARRERA